MNRKKMQAALEKSLPADLAAEVHERVTARIERMDAGRERYGHKALEKHFGENILPVLALYLTLKERDDLSADALELTRKVAEEVYAVARKRMAFLGRLPFFYWLIQKLAPGKMKRNFPAEGWEIEWLEVSREQVAFNMHSCFYLDALTRYGAPELTPVFCGLDDLIYDGVSPHLRWQRSTTLGRGGERCDFRFIRAKRP
ncbi:MAG: L-2-amino-thiazoline-4-carboxylic acid hydrolase [Chloroflexi bacterium]|nr:L-2-amino-thiazoline-4-carboxylic acid hydrolase [Chloroflexota bacterium]